MKSDDNSKSRQNRKLMDDASETRAQPPTIHVTDNDERISPNELLNYAHADTIPFAKTSKSRQLAIAISSRTQRSRENEAFDLWLGTISFNPRMTNDQPKTSGAAETPAHLGPFDK